MFNGVYNSLLEFYRCREKQLSEDKKIQKLVQRFRDIAKERRFIPRCLIYQCSCSDGKNRNVYEKLAKCCIRIETTNSFPTASGMASSASGFACLSKALADVYGVLNTEKEEAALNAITRQASGSACRSLYGGLVYWKKGSLTDGSDSVAVAVSFLH